jgi:hypothetical protein
MPFLAFCYLRHMYHNIEAPESDFLYVVKSSLPNAGKGLFTAIDIFKNEIIAIFAGEILSQKEAEKRATAQEDQYFINLLDGRILDSKHTHCFAKFANDANGTSGKIHKNNAKIALDDNNNICLVATKKISAGSEVFVDYGKRYAAKHFR